MLIVAVVIFVMCSFSALGAGLFAAWSDFRGMKIPNLYPAFIALAFIPAWIVMWLAGGQEIFSSPLSHVLSGLMIFFVTYGMFVTRIFGAGDAKLVTAYAFWTGFHGLPVYLFYLTACGGVLALATLGLRRWKPFRAVAGTSWIGRVQSGEKVVPYGIAITFGAIVAFLQLGYFSPARLSLLLQ